MPDMMTRPYEAGDAALLAEFMVQLGTAAGAEPGLTADSVRAWFSGGLVRDPAADTRLIFAEDGQLAAAALLAAPADGGVRVDAFGGVLPGWRGRGLGRTLLGWQIDRARRLYEAYNEAMADHYDFESRELASWAEVELQAGVFRPDLTRLAFDGPAIAAYVIVSDEPDGRVRIDGVGTRRPWRRKGPASALVAEVMTAAAAAGKTRATLGVDSQSPTGAVGIYAALGFEVTSSWVSYRLQLA